ncbi:response regulator transcription factor [Cumulibacter soli]|uniref:response regulator transcription factor n=1 Tax=Cumulibacter soli TaxID=2546344 RepID=UPI0010678EEB|nr:response regulator transcription factor [Cumulibacter soli]
MARNGGDEVPSVLLIEDDENVARAVSLGLQRLDYVVRVLDRGTDELEGLVLATDVVVLDIGLPGMDGFALCRRIRAVSDVPVVMLTARSEDIDQVAGLEAGGDDYVVKPVSPRVLDARIKAVLRRVRSSEPAEVSNHAARRELVIDDQGMRVFKGGAEVQLTPTEMRLLLVLNAHEGAVLSREQLLAAAWNQDYLGNSRLVDASVGRLRVKIEDDPNIPQFIHTVRGFGYRLTTTRRPES